MNNFASKWVQFCINSVDKSKGIALDLACGKGRHSTFLEKIGFKVIAVDNTSSNFSFFSGKNILKIYKDVECLQNWPIYEKKFDVIVVTKFLNRSIFPKIISSLKKGGYLIYETFSEGHEKIGSPRNPDYILRSKELILLCKPLSLIAFEEVQSINYDNGYIMQRILSKNV
jgi:SAM-dependent methyltransferase